MNRRRVLGLVVGTAIFIILISLTGLFVRPIYVRLEAKITETERMLSRALTDATGLSLSYRSLSPSLFSNVSIRGIEISDVASKRKIASIRKAVMEYDVEKLFSADPLSAFESLTVSGISVEYDSVENSEVTRRLVELFGGKDADGGKKSSFDIAGFRLPFAVIVKDISLHYSDGTNDAVTRIKRLDLSDAGAGGIGVVASGNAVFCTDKIREGNRRAEFGVSYNLSGTFFGSLEGSSATLQLTRLPSHDYSVTRLDMLMNYGDSKIQFRTMRTRLPYSAFMEIDFAKEKLRAAMTADGFDPMKLFSVRRLPSLAAKLSGSTISGTAGAEVSLSGGGISFETDLVVRLTAGLLGSPSKIVCVSKGNERVVKFKKASLENSYLGASFVGDMAVKGLALTGNAALDYLKLPNGSYFSSDLVFIEPAEGEIFGVTGFSPQFYLNSSVGTKAVTGLETTVQISSSSVDFIGQFYDYSHSESGSVASFDVDGSVLIDSNVYVQVKTHASDLYGDSAAEAVAFFLGDDAAASVYGMKEKLSPYLFTGDVYVSVDVDSLEYTFNAPNCIFADERSSSDRILFAAADGTSQSIQISSFNLRYGDVGVQATASVDLSAGFDDISFRCDLLANSLPYSLSGNITPQWISLSGNYGFESMVSIAETGFSDGVSGFVQFNQLPVPLGTYIFTASTMSTFAWSAADGIDVNVARCELSEATGALPMDPRVSFTGRLANYGFDFSALTYSDRSSQLDFSGSVNWYLSDGTIDYASLELGGKNPYSPESVSVSANLSNPSHLPLSAESVLNDFYLSANVSVDSFPSSRFLPNQNAGNVIDATVSATGTIKNPFVSIDVRKASMLLSGYDFDARGVIVLDDNGLNVTDVSASWAFFRLSGFSAAIDAGTLCGTASAVADISLAGRDLHVPLDMTLTSVLDGAPASPIAVPDFFSVSVSSPGATGTMFRHAMPFTLNVVHIPGQDGEPGQIDVFTDNRKGFHASVVGGHITASTGRNPTLAFDLDGRLEGGGMDFIMSGIECDLARVCDVVDIPMISFGSGHLSGNVRISGLTTDPEFAGFVDIGDFSLSVPTFSPYPLTASAVQVAAGADGVNMPETVFSCGKGAVALSSDITFDRWSIANVSVRVSTKKFRGLPVDMTMPFMHLKGDARADVSLSISMPDEMVVSGSLYADNTDLEIVASELQNQLSFEGLMDSLIKNSKLSMEKIFGKSKKKKEKEKKDDEAKKKSEEAAPAMMMNVAADLRVNVGQNVRILFNPFMRGVLAPNTPIDFSFDTRSGEFSIVGDVSLHGGEVAWLNRNFYLKNGLISFNETQDGIDPRVTIRAETKERDSEGNRVTIVLSAENQPVSKFNPVFSATPAKSEYEIMELLGEVLTADSDNISSIALAGGDYLVQATVIREIENALRELCNFDIFSIRTNVLQNAIKQGFSQDKDDEDGQVTFSNFFDNSTVYIGKYFGSAIYVDAMFHWVYDETKLADGNSVDGLVFQPEFGFEMASPFVNIRLGVSPDIESIQNNMWLPSTSITLSWKHSF